MFFIASDVMKELRHAGKQTWKRLEMLENLCIFFKQPTDNSNSWIVIFPWRWKLLWAMWVICYWCFLFNFSFHNFFLHFFQSRNIVSTAQRFFQTLNVQFWRGKRMKNEKWQLTTECKKIYFSSSDAVGRRDLIMLFLHPTFIW